MTYVGKKPSFKQVRTNEIVVPKGTDITTAGVITALSVSNISFVRLTAATELQGIVAPESPANDGKLVTITNASASDLFIRNESSGAAAADRIVTGAGRDLRVTVGASFTAAYDIGSSRWRVTASSADVNIGRLDVGVGTLALSSEDVSLTPSNVNASLIEVTAGVASAIRSVDTVNTGNVIVFTNKTGATFQVKDEDLGATIANRIRTGTGGPLTIQNNASVMLAYSVDRWYVVGGTGTGGGAVEQVSQTGIGILANYPVGTPLYVDASAWNKASATAANTAEVAGLISRRLNDDLVEVALAGEVSEVTSSAFIEGVLPARGEVVFLSTTTGKLTVSDVTTIGYVSKPIGIVHNVNGSPTPTSVDIMFYNQRGIVVGSVNARTQINLGGSAGSSTVTPIQNISAYEAGEIAGWINIDATTDYGFYFQAQFAKIPNTSNYNIAVPQTVGSTPPLGFSMDVVAGVVQVTLPALAGFVSAYANFALNAPAVGTSLPLSVNSSSVYTTYKSVTGAYNITTADSLIAASGASPYAVTLPTAVGALGATYTIKSTMNAGISLTVNTTSSQLIDTVTSRALATGEVLKVVSDGAKWIVVVSEQDVTATASPTFTGAKVTGLTASRAIQTDANDNLISAGFGLPATTGSLNQVLSSDGAGSSSWTSSPTFLGINVTGLTASRGVQTDASKNLISAPIAIYNATVTTSGTVDASLGNSFIQNGSGSRTITVSNLADGQTININVQGANGNVISWTTAGLTQKTGVTYSNTMTSVNSIYTLVRLGNNVFISSLHGFG